MPSSEYPVTFPALPKLTSVHTITHHTVTFLPSCPKRDPRHSSLSGCRDYAEYPQPLLYSSSTWGKCGQPGGPSIHQSRKGLPPFPTCDSPPTLPQLPKMGSTLTLNPRGDPQSPPPNSYIRCLSPPHSQKCPAQGCLQQFTASHSGSSCCHSGTKEGRRAQMLQGGTLDSDPACLPETRWSPQIAPFARVPKLDADQATRFSAGEGPSWATMCPCLRGQHSAAACNGRASWPGPGTACCPSSLDGQTHRHLRGPGPCILDPWIDAYLAVQERGPARSNAKGAPQSASPPWLDKGCRTGTAPSSPLAAALRFGGGEE